jgi:hypothetical protein
LNRTHALDLTGKKHQESRYESTAPDLEHQQPTKKKKNKKNKKKLQSEQKTPHKGGQTTPTGGERTSISLSYPKGSIERGEENPLKR